MNEQFKVGEIAIWQNCTGPFAFLNGTETTVTGPLEQGVDMFTFNLGPMAYPTDTPNPYRPGFLLADLHELRKKRPPESDDATARQAMLDCIERAKQPLEVEHG